MFSETRLRLTRFGLPRLTLTRDPTVLALALIVLAGLALRVWLTLQWRPALVGFPDADAYLADARSGIFNDPLRVAGYAEFLRLMHGIVARLWFAMLVQHVLGVASGLLLYGAVVRAGLPRWLGLVPAGVVILGGAELLLEHAPLTEAVFIFLVDLCLYALVRAWRGGWGWLLLAGAALGLAADVRTVGLVLAVAIIIAAPLLCTGAWRARLLSAAVLLAAAAVPVAGYLVAHREAVGYGGFTGEGYFDLYARVAPFAECSRIRPPPGTGRLCIHIPRGQRPGHDVWEFTRISPAVRVFGKPDKGPPRPGENATLRSFALAAIMGQPVDYLEAVGRDLVRIVDPSFSSSPYGAVGNAGYGITPERLTEYHFDTRRLADTRRFLRPYYPGERETHGSVGLLRDYEQATRIEGPLMALMLLLAAAGPLLLHSGERRPARLFSLAALVLLAAPVFVSEYDYRFTIPAFGPLAAAAALGGLAVARRFARPARASRSRFLARLSRAK